MIYCRFACPWSQSPLTESSLVAAIELGASSTTVTEAITRKLHTLAHTRTYTHMYIHTYIKNITYIHTRIQTGTCMHAHTYIHAHTCIHADTPVAPVLLAAFSPGFSRTLPVRQQPTRSARTCQCTQAATMQAALACCCHNSQKQVVSAPLAANECSWGL
jgi:hypothetical protein